MRPATCAALAACLLSALTLATPTLAHRSGCHHWHSCPSDTGSYVCGNLGYCSQCPDNAYCQAGRPRAVQAPPPLLQAPPVPHADPAPTLPDPMPDAARTLAVQVMRVIDGDTIEVQLGPRRETVRYIGINTPETRHPQKGAEPGGQEAKALNRKLVSGKAVRLEFDVQERDRYRRLLAYVYVGDLMVNAELVREGYAEVMTIPPNVRHQDLFLRLQRAAREAGRGLWRR